jgi:hypothetical protein
MVTVLATLLAACGGAAPGSTQNVPPGSTSRPATAAPGGPVDCAALEAAAQEFVAVQLLAQLTTPETVQSIRSNALGNLDLDEFLGAIDELRALEAFPSPLGDPKTSLDRYEKAATAAKTLFAMDPVTQAAIDAYNEENIGTVGSFIGHQIAISGAMDEAGC